MPSNLSVQKLLKLPVVTVSGTALGRVSDIELDKEDMRLERLCVQPAGITGLLKEPLLIHRSQIIHILADKIIVEDTLTPKPQPADQVTAGSA